MEKIDDLIRRRAKDVMEKLFMVLNAILRDTPPETKEELECRINNIKSKIYIVSQILFGRGGPCEPIIITDTGELFRTLAFIFEGYKGYEGCSPVIQDHGSSYIDIRFDDFEDRIYFFNPSIPHFEESFETLWSKMEDAI